MTEIKEKRVESYKKYAEIRDAKGFKSDYSVAKKAGITRAIFTRWHEGIARPNADNTAKIAKALGVSIARLV